MFIPKRIIFENRAFDYPLGQELYVRFQDQDGIEIIRSAANKIKDHIPGESRIEKYQNAKTTLIVGVKKGLKFQTCKPSAHYQLPLVTGCMGQCEYCYLNTRFYDRPYLKIYVNIEDILSQAQKYIKDRLPEITVFEGAATSDPLPLEPYTHALERTIKFFAQEEKGRFRFVTKFTDIESLKAIDHRSHSEIRFSLNAERIVKSYEHHTPAVKRRIAAAAAMAARGYPLGFIIAPVIIYDHWQEDYRALLMEIKNNLPEQVEHPPTFEVISHRYTLKAKETIETLYPESQLPMDENNRQFKFGQFGYGKYIYPKDQMDEINSFFTKEIKIFFPQSLIKYII